MNYTQTIQCPYCNSPIKLSIVMLDDNTPRIIIIEEHQHVPTLSQLEACGIELGIEIIEENEN